MSKAKYTQQVNYDNGVEMMDEDDFDDADIDEVADNEDIVISPDMTMAYRRSWRDTEKRREMRELYKLINDELYTGFNDSDFTENEYER